MSEELAIHLSLISGWFFSAFRNVSKNLALLMMATGLQNFVLLLTVQKLLSQNWDRVRPGWLTKFDTSLNLLLFFVKVLKNVKTRRNGSNLLISIGAVEQNVFFHFF